MVLSVFREDVSLKNAASFRRSFRLKIGAAACGAPTATG
jgi:hypothetical protein